MSLRKFWQLGYLLIFLPFALFSSEFAPGYPDYEQMVSEIYQLAERYPSQTEIVVYGKSVEGRDLLALHIFLGDGRSRPCAMICGNIHGNEMIGNRMAMAIAQRLLEGAKSDPWIQSLLDKMEFWILPCLNPDGYFKTVELYQKSDLSGHRKNAHQVDLNRNFLLPGPRTLKINWAGSEKKERNLWTNIRFLPVSIFTALPGFFSLPGAPIRNVPGGTGRWAGLLSSIKRR